MRHLALSHLRYLALAAVLLVLSVPVAGTSTVTGFGAAQPIILAFDDEVYGDHPNNDEQDGIGDQAPSYGDDNNDDDDDSANAPDDDDDGWDIDPYERSERA